MISMSLAQELREQTRSQHESLHEVVNLASMLQSRESYGRALACYLDAVEPTELALERYAKIDSTGSLQSLELHTRLQKRSWLWADIERLGTGRHSQHAADEAIEIDSLASFAGTAYVLEGMTLGGRQISRLLAEKLGVETDTGGRFFAGYGEATGQRWQQFKSWLQSLEVDHDVAVVAAQRTFDQFRQCLSRS